MKRAMTGTGSAVAAATVFYGGDVAVTYLRFGRAACKAERNPLLDRLMPEYDVRERHSVSMYGARRHHARRRARDWHPPLLGPPAPASR